MGAGFVEVGIDRLLFRFQRCKLGLDLFDGREFCESLVVEEFLGGAVEQNVPFMCSQELLGVAGFSVGHIRVPRLDVM